MSKTVVFRNSQSGHYIALDSSWKWFYANADKSRATRFDVSSPASGIAVVGMGDGWLNYRNKSGAAKVYDEPTGWTLVEQANDTVALKSIESDQYMGVWSAENEELYVRGAYDPRGGESWAERSRRDPRPASAARAGVGAAHVSANCFSARRSKNARVVSTASRGLNA